MFNSLPLFAVVDCLLFPIIVTWKVIFNSLVTNAKRVQLLATSVRLVCCSAQKHKHISALQKSLSPKSKQIFFRNYDYARKKNVFMAHI